MTNPTITLITKGWTGSEIINYGYINHKGEVITIKTNARVGDRSAPKEHKFQINETDPPKAAWLELTSDGFTSSGGQKMVIMEGLEYNGTDMWDPDYEDWPGNNSWNEGEFALGTSNNTSVNAGAFKWKGTYRMGFDPTKIVSPPPPPGSSPPAGSSPPPSSPPSSPSNSPIWNPGEDGFFSASNVGMWAYIGVAVVFLVLIFVLVM